MSGRQPISLANTKFLGAHRDNDVKYFFYEAKLSYDASDAELAECLKFRYQKYGDVVFERKSFSDSDSVIFTLIEPVLPKNIN